MILITTIEHAGASVLHDITIGARATAGAIEKLGSVVTKDAPTIEVLTALVDPRAAVIERVGAAVLGQILPQLDKIATDTEGDVAAPTVTLTAELVAELKSLAASVVAELAAAKTSLAS